MVRTHQALVDDRAQRKGGTSMRAEVAKGVDRSFGSKKYDVLIQKGRS
jgi:hypothetical protein